LQLKDFSKIKQMMDKRACWLKTTAQRGLFFKGFFPAFLNFSPEVLTFEKN